MTPCYVSFNSRSAAAPFGGFQQSALYGSPSATPTAAGISSHQNHYQSAFRFGFSTPSLGQQSPGGLLTSVTASVGNEQNFDGNSQFLGSTFVGDQGDFAHHQRRAINCCGFNDLR
jgi:hypothetical protein